MNNREKLNNMTDEEFAEYINAVYLAGKLEVIHNLKGQYSDTVDYIKWLKEKPND